MKWENRFPLRESWKLLIHSVKKGEGGKKNKDSLHPPTNNSLALLGV
jgi:hypothetical protein